MDTISPKGGLAEPTVVAIDRDKNSQHAVRWAVDNLRLMEKTIILVHVATSQQNLFNQDCESRAPTHSEMQQLFLPYRGFCARKGVRTKEVVLHDLDVATALSDYIGTNSINNVVLGASSRSAISRAFKNADVSTSVGKLAPDSCSVYAVSKGKAHKIKSSSDSITPYTALPPHISQRQGSPVDSPSEVSIGSSAPTTSYSTTSNDSKHLFVWEKRQTPPESVNTSFESTTWCITPPNRARAVEGSPRLDSFSSSDQSEQQSYMSDISYLHLDDPRASDASIFSTTSTLATELEDELKRVKLELKQITDKYNAACLESTTAREKGRGITCRRSDNIAEAKHNEELALVIVECEQQNCKAALEVAKRARMLAELESEKRIQAEKKFVIESKQKEQVLDALAHSLARCRRYWIEEIEAATDNFSSNKIGEGSYGPVYKATVDHTPVAIKILKSDISEGLKQFQQEVEVLSRMRHPNMVLLLGACPEYGCLVYEYMENGCLEDRLFCKDDTPPLSWTMRFTIAAEIATGLNFLHQTRPQPLVHRDLKPANILLDKNYVSKIGDVGLSRLVPPSVADKVTQYRMTAAAGTFCYIDPEYQHTGLLGTKADVYSLGIILLQIITAKLPMGLRHQVQTAIETGRFVEILDQRVKDWPVEEALSLANLGLKCSELRRRDRPNLDLILPELERLREVGSLFKPEKKSYYFTYSQDQSSQENLSSYQEITSIYAMLRDDQSESRIVTSSKGVINYEDMNVTSK